MWTINRKSYKGAHFAVFPPEIPEVCIRAGTSAHGACASCGAPWARAGESWQRTCACGTEEVTPCLVLDPFAGSGTTLAVAKSQRRDYLGIELNPEYARLMQGRLDPLCDEAAQRLAFDKVMGYED